VKEAHGFVLLPGGFGTLDEAFELLTLIQTGKSQPAPIVLLDVPDGTYWATWRAFVAAEMIGRGYVGKDDLDLVLVTDDVETAVDEVTGFYANYHSQRFVEGRLVIRLQRAPDAAELARLTEEFADIVVRGEGLDRIELERVAFRFDRRSHARLRALIDRLNGR